MMCVYCGREHAWYGSRLRVARGLPIQHQADGPAKKKKKRLLWTPADPQLTDKDGAAYQVISALFSSFVFCSLSLLG